MFSKLADIKPEALHLIEVIGRINHDGATTLHDKVTGALARDRTALLVDLRGVDYINSSGLRALVQLYKKIKQQNGTLILVNPTENVKRLLELVGLDTVFDIQYDARINSGAINLTKLPVRSREICYCM